MGSIRRALIIATIAGVALWGRSLAIFSHGSLATAPPPTLENATLHLEPGYALGVLREVPEDITALAVATAQTPELTGEVFVGTGPKGSVSNFNFVTPATCGTIGEGLGDYFHFGICEVNTLALRDLDRDGTPELLAATSQILPRGRPRLYAWSLAAPHALRGMARPDIRSSWSHGIGFLGAPDAPSQSTYVTFCGFGEIVEFQLASDTTEEGFARESLRWKKVGQLPVSGESVLTTDVDHDGQTEIVVATGFATDLSAIHIYAADRPGSDLRLERVIDEGRRFFNVRFLVGDTRGIGGRDLVAWWCQAEENGECEVIRYRLGPEGVRERTVLALGTKASLWPCDGQMALMDMDEDGHPELWFVNGTGTLWRHDESQSEPLVRIAQVEGRFGPIAAAPATSKTPPALLLGWGRSVLRLTDETRQAPPGRTSSRFRSLASHRDKK
jgi:FG-GAP repeat